MNNDTGTAQLYAVPREGGERIQLTEFQDFYLAGYIYSPTEKR